MQSCVGAINGFLVTIIYQPVHIRTQLINHIQVVNPVWSQNSRQFECHICHFIALWWCPPENSWSLFALERTVRYNLVQKLPLQVICCWDAAYTLMDQVLVSFTGSQNHNSDKKPTSTSSAANFAFASKWYLGFWWHNLSSLVQSTKKLSVTAAVLECVAPVCKILYLTKIGTAK